MNVFIDEDYVLVERALVRKTLRTSTQRSAAFSQRAAYGVYAVLTALRLVRIMRFGKTFGIFHLLNRFTPRVTVLEESLDLEKFARINMMM